MSSGEVIHERKGKPGRGKFLSRLLLEKLELKTFGVPSQRLYGT
jgi:hypothetical protein